MTATVGPGVVREIGPRFVLVAALIPTLTGDARPLRAAESALTVADLAAYRAALSGKGGADRPPVAVDFRKLWADPESYRGRRVRVEGRVVRRFRQGAFGTFPPLEEVWTFSRSGDPCCLVFPPSLDQAEAGVPAKAGAETGRAEVRFVGTFLKLIEYQGGDGPRLAPLIVGPEAPVVVSAPSDREAGTAIDPGFRLSRADWALGLGAALLVALVLARQHLRRPSRRPSDREDAPAPLFEDERE